ncbi:MAG TPA: hypothetical protein VK988_19900 [Acidimicrobiales bacterium]|nr:hypothetical protein [Acidimicrobiales bacterium]
MSPFNIGSQSAGRDLYNIEGRAVVANDRAVVTIEGAQRALAEVRHALDAARLDKKTTGDARATLDAVDADLQRDDAGAAASQVGGLIERLRRAGDWVAAGATLVEPLTRLARALGLPL